MAKDQPHILTHSQLLKVYPLLQGCIIIPQSGVSHKH